MNDIKIMKAMQREAKKQFNSKWAEKITIKYDLRKASETNDSWTVGDTFQYQNVPCLKEIISNLNFVDNQTANIQINKANFYIPYDGYDFSENKKRNIKVIDKNKMIFVIDKVIPIVPFGNSYLYWCLIQK